MFILITSPSAITNNLGIPLQAMVQALIEVKNKGTLVAVISNKSEPSWFASFLGKEGIAFIQYPGRQNGSILNKISVHKNTATYNLLVLAGSDTDIQMAKNGNSILLGAGWSSEVKVRNLGIKVDSPSQISYVIDLMKGWNGDWWFKSDQEKYSVRALMDLSSYGKDNTQIAFSSSLTNTVKNGGAHLTALLIVTSRSLLIENINNTTNLLWAVYPSSTKNTNKSPEILSDFTHRLRTTTSRVHFAKDGEPLFIRHSSSMKRSTNKSISRTNPADQIQTLNINPFYKNKIQGKNIIIIDDCTTYGLSFGVATAFLLKAGAASVKCLALGKFGNAINYFNIKILTDPFLPVASNEFEVIEERKMSGLSNNNTQENLLKIIV